MAEQAPNWIDSLTERRINLSREIGNISRRLVEDNKAYNEKIQEMISVNDELRVAGIDPVALAIRIAEEAEMPSPVLHIVE